MTKSEAIELLPTLSYEELMLLMATKLANEGWKVQASNTLEELTNHIESGESTLSESELSEIVARIKKIKKDKING